MSFIDRCLCEIFPTELEIVPWNSKPLTIIATRIVISSINGDDTALNVNTNSHGKALGNKLNSCHYVVN